MSSHQQPAGRGRGRPILGQGATLPQSPGSPAPTPQQAPPPPQAPPASGFALSVTAAPFVPSWQRQNYNLPDPVEVLKIAINDLILDPEQFDERVVPVIPTFIQTIQTEDKLREVIEELVENGISAPNKRNLSARLCGYFSTNFTAQYSNGNFKQHLLKRLHREHVKREQRMADEATHQVQGFTLFMAELLANLMTTDGTPLVIIANALYELLSLLMSTFTEQSPNHVTEPSLSCVVQALKLVGHLMERAEVASDANSTPQMDSLMLKIKDCVVAENLSRRIRRQLLRAVELRALLWDLAVSERAAPPSSDSVPTDDVYFGDNGQMYSWEDANYYDLSQEDDAAIREFQETLCIEDNGPVGNGLHDEDHNLPWSSNDGDVLDDEASAAYESFLAWQQNNHANHN